MSRSHAIVSLLLAASMIPIVASAAEHAAQPTAAAGEPASAATLDEEYFQRVVRNYQKYQHDGRVVYCKKEKPITSSVPLVQCIYEDALRAQVQNARRARNAVTPSTG